MLTFWGFFYGGSCGVEPFCVVFFLFVVDLRFTIRVYNFSWAMDLNWVGFVGVGRWMAKNYYYRGTLKRTEWYSITVYHTKKEFDVI